MFNRLAKRIRQFLNLTYYTSELDQFLSDFDKSHPRMSAPQRKEKDKYDRIFTLRDTRTNAETKKSIWGNF